MIFLLLFLHVVRMSTSKHSYLAKIYSQILHLQNALILKVYCCDAPVTIAFFISFPVLFPSLSYFSCKVMTTVFHVLFGCPTANFGQLPRRQPSYLDVNHFVYLVSTQRSLGASRMFSLAWSESQFKKRLSSTKILHI